MSFRAGFAQVRGYSMVPTLVPHDRILVRYGATFTAGDIVLFERNGRIDIKRVDHIDDQGVYLLGDNEYASLDSRTYGSIDPERIIGKAVLRLWPHPGKLAYLPED